MKTKPYTEREIELASMTTAYIEKHRGMTVPAATWKVLDGQGIFDRSVRERLHHQICSVLGKTGANKADANRETAKLDDPQMALF